MNPPNLIPTMSLTGLSMCLLSSGGAGLGIPSPAEPLPCASWRVSPAGTSRLRGGDLPACWNLQRAGAGQGWEALLTVSRRGGSTQLKLDSGILRAPASVRPSIRPGEGCCQPARAGRSLDVSLHPPQGSLALIFSHPRLAFGQRLLPLAWPCGHLLISRDFKGRVPPLNTHPFLLVFYPPSSSLPSLPLFSSPGPSHFRVLRGFSPFPECPLCLLLISDFCLPLGDGPVSSWRLQAPRTIVVARGPEHTKKEPPSLAIWGYFWPCCSPLGSLVLWWLVGGRRRCWAPAPGCNGPSL